MSDFAAALLTKGSAHYRVGNQVVVKLPGSFTSDTTSRGLIDEEVHARGPLWTNKELVEINDDTEGTPLIINDRTLAVEREIFVSSISAYTDTATFRPLTLVACEPGYEPDHEEFTETIPEMQERVEKEIEAEREAQRLERIRQMQKGADKVTEMDTTPALSDPTAIPGTNLHVVTPQGVTMEDFSKTGQAVVDLTGPTDDPASLGNVGGQASQPQGAAGGSKAGSQISDEELNARLLLLKCLDKMNNDQNILEDAYYKCVEIVREVVKEVSADLDDMENAYVAAVMKALGKWQDSGAKALQAMHTASAKEWDKLHSELTQATVEFRNSCLEAETTEAHGIAKVSSEIASGVRKDPATDIMERSFKSTRKVVDDAAENFSLALKDSWMGSVSSQQLPTLVASSYGVLMTFRTAIWHLISGESVWPSRLRSAGFCKMAPIVHQSLTSIPALCDLVVPPRPVKATTAPPSPVQSYLMGKSSAAASPQASSSGPGGSTPTGTPTAPKKPFRTLPQPSSSPMGPPATTQPLLCRPQTPGASSAASPAAAGPSQRPGVFTSFPSLKLGTLPSTVPRKAGSTAPTMSSAGLTVATPSLTVPVGGRSSFATNPYIARPAGRSQSAGGSSEDSDKAVASDIAKLAQEASRKRHLEEGDGDDEEEGNEETDGSDIEDMTVPAKKGKGRQSPAKSSKRESATENYTEADIAVVHANRYARNFATLQNYRSNVASPEDTNAVNLASHEAYLDLVTASRALHRMWCLTMRAARST